MIEIIKTELVKKAKTHTNIAILLSTKAKIEEYRRYQRETYDEIIVRLIDMGEKS